MVSDYTFGIIKTFLTIRWIVGMIKYDVTPDDNFNMNTLTK